MYHEIHFKKNQAMQKVYEFHKEMSYTETGWKYPFLEAKKSN